MSTPNSPETAPPRPIGAVIAAVVLVLEALALLAAAGFLVYGLVAGTTFSVASAAFEVVLVLLLAGWLLAVGHFLFRGYRWTRSAALVWQLFLIVLSFPLFSAGLAAVALGMLIPAVVVLVLLFTKPVLAFMTRKTNKTTTL